VKGVGLVQPMNQPKELVRGALILTVAALLIKILSAIYRIPFQNIVGDVGFYIYQQVYPIYGVALVMSTTGYPVIISKLYAEQKNRSGQAGIQQLMVVSAVYLFLLGIVMFLALFLGAEWVAQRMNDPDLYLLIRVIAVVFLIFPFTALLRGYYQGTGYMVPTAFSQVGEQLARVGTILVTAYVFVNANYSMYEVGAGAVFGSVTGGLVGLLILLTFVWWKKEFRAVQIKNVHRSLPLGDAANMIKTLFIQGFAVCVSGMLLLLLQLADSLNLYSLLLSTGVDGEAAKGLKGIYDRGQPLIQLGSVVATSMSLSLVPLIASEKRRNSPAALIEKIGLALRVSMTVGLGATVGLMTIIEPTNIMLFENRDGSEVLALLSGTILLSSLIITLIAILQGLGHTLFPAFVILVGFVAKYGFNLWFVPANGVMGAASASIGALAMIMIVLFLRLYFVLGRPSVSWKFLLKVTCGAVTMFIILKGFLAISNVFYLFGNTRLMATIQALGGVLLGGLSYLFVVIRMRGFTVHELTLLPFGSKLLYLVPGKRRR